MERITMRMEEEMIGGLEALVDDGEFPNRSEAVRAAVRDMLQDDEQDSQRRPTWQEVDD